jgi:hypothetical protein
VEEEEEEGEAGQHEASERRAHRGHDDFVALCGGRGRSCGPWGARDGPVGNGDGDAIEIAPGARNGDDSHSMTRRDAHFLLARGVLQEKRNDRD